MRSTMETNVMRIVVMIVSIWQSMMVYLEYSLKLRLEKLQMRRLKEDSLVSSRYIYPLLMEMCYLSVACPPNVDVKFQGELLKGQYVYSLDSIIFVLTLGKIYFFIRVWL